VYTTVGDINISGGTVVMGDPGGSNGDVYDSNLIVSGASANVTVNGNITNGGDLTVSDGTVAVTGNIAGDLSVSGGATTVGGAVSGTTSHTGGTVNGQSSPTGTAPTITTTTLPNGTVDTAYSQTLAASGTAPIAWTIDSGALPGGLSLNNSTGEISGTPTTAGTANFTVKAANGVSPDATKALSIATDPAPPTVSSVTVSPVAIEVQQGGTQQFAATVAGTNNPPQTVTWSVTNGTGSTNIGASGLLTVDAAQTTASALTVRATSTIDNTKYGEATVTVTNTPPTPVYTVTFDASGGSVTPATTQTGVDGKLASLPTLTRSRYRFDGWFTAASGGTQITTGTVFTANTTVYAQWTYTGGSTPSGNGGSGAAPVPVTPIAPGSGVTVTKASLTYISGQNRVETALAISRQGWTSAETVIIAPGGQSNLIDALAAAPLAGQENAPILLCVGGVDPAVIAEIQRLGAKKIYAVGALSEAALETLKAALPGLTLETLRGADRFETAALAGARVNEPKGTFIVGYNAVADAVSAASFAAANGYVIQIASPDGWSARPLDPELSNLPVYILGGPTLVQNVPGATRLYGATRYETNKAVRDALTFDYTNIYTADGDTLVDALTGSALAARTRSAIVLAPGNDPTGVDFGKITQETVVYAFGKR
jgi:hypothetical protein